MSKFKYAILSTALLVAGLSTVAHAQGGPGLSVVPYNGQFNPCQNPSIAKSSAPVAITAAATTSLVTAVAGKRIYVCGFFSTVAGTTPTVKFETGTQTTTACDTGAAALTGTFAIATGDIFNLEAATGLFKGAAGGQVCLVGGGTITGIEGFVVYAQL
jgi:hypothetical protein